jgi:hypothetical protein
MTLSLNPADEEILCAVESWIDDLSRGDFDSAYTRTDHDTYYQWSPELIRSVIEGYGSPVLAEQTRKSSATSRTLAAGEAPRRVVDRTAMPPNSNAYVEYSLPLDGAWSDLSATFRVEPRESGCALVLEEIHVR